MQLAEKQELVRLLKRLYIYLLRRHPGHDITL